MKKIAFVVLAMCVGLMLSCSPSADVAPKSQKSLGMVIPPATQSSSSNFILLKDGRTANPVSGISNFASMSIGNKLSLTFTAGSTHNGVTDIHVSQFASAEDSVFTPVGPITDTTSFTGTFYGASYTFDNDSTFHINANTSIHFTTPNQYKCDGVVGVGYPLPGSGTFVASDSTTVTFTDFNTNSNTVLNGSFTYVLNSAGLYMWAERNGVHYGYSLRRN